MIIHEYFMKFMKLTCRCQRSIVVRVFDIDMIIIDRNWSISGVNLIKSTCQLTPDVGSKLTSILIKIGPKLVNFSQFWPFLAIFGQNCLPLVPKRSWPFWAIRSDPWIWHGIARSRILTSHMDHQHGSLWVSEILDFPRIRSDAQCPLIPVFRQVSQVCGLAMVNFRKSAYLIKPLSPRRVLVLEPYSDKANFASV